jgi:hypothetical protein
LGRKLNEWKPKGEGSSDKLSAKSSVSVKVRNFDLVRNDEKNIEQANINGNVPMKSKSCDYVVLCLALMGKDCSKAIQEAWRLLKPEGKGVLVIAEVTSRFESRKTFCEQVEGIG